MADFRPANILRVLNEMLESEKSNRQHDETMALTQFQLQRGIYESDRSYNLELKDKLATSLIGAHDIAVESRFNAHKKISAYMQPWSTEFFANPAAPTSDEMETFRRHLIDRSKEYQGDMGSVKAERFVSLIAANAKDPNEIAHTLAWAEFMNQELTDADFDFEFGLAAQDTKRNLTPKQYKGEVGFDLSSEEVYNSIKDKSHPMIKDFEDIITRNRDVGKIEIAQTELYNINPSSPTAKDELEHFAMPSPKAMTEIKESIIKTQIENQNNQQNQNNQNNQNNQQNQNNTGAIDYISSLANFKEEENSQVRIKKLRDYLGINKKDKPLDWNYSLNADSVESFHNKILESIDDIEYVVNNWDKKIPSKTDQSEAYKGHYIELLNSLQSEEERISEQLDRLQDLSPKNQFSTKAKNWSSKGNRGINVGNVLGVPINVGSPGANLIGAGEESLINVADPNLFSVIGDALAENTRKQLLSRIENKRKAINSGNLSEEYVQNTLIPQLNKMLVDYNRRYPDVEYASREE
jgi:hypothetical protein